MASSSRRQFVQNTVAAGISLAALVSPAKADDSKPVKPLKVVCIGGHPDDPETGCAGTLLKFINAGHSVTIIYLTRGEAGIKHKTHDEAAAIRTKEAEAACEFLKAKPVFAGQIDGDGMVTTEWVKKMMALLDAEKPDIVFSQWPVDTHKDHQCAGILAFQAWSKMKSFELYFYEVCTGEQTMIFYPTDYVDITDVQEAKHKSALFHVSQKLPGIYVGPYPIHLMMEQFRGAEIGVKAAEGFVKVNGHRQGNNIPGLS